MTIWVQIFMQNTVILSWNDGIGKEVNPLLFVRDITCKKKKKTGGAVDKRWNLGKEKTRVFFILPP